MGQKHLSQTGPEKFLEVSLGLIPNADFFFCVSKFKANQFTPANIQTCAHNFGGWTRTPSRIRVSTHKLPR